MLLRNSKGQFVKNHEVLKKWRDGWRKAFKGKHHSPKTEFKVGNHPKTELKNGHKLWVGKKHKQESKDKMSVSQLKRFEDPRNHPNYMGGKSFEPYGIEFNNRLKENIRKRDCYRCQQCFRHQDELYYKSGKKYSLIVHHIDYNKQNNSPENLISLCHSCHLQTNYERKDWTNYFNNKLIFISS